MKSTEWYYKFPGEFYANGPTKYNQPMTLRQVRQNLRERFYPGKKKLPNDFAVWKAN